MMMEATALAVVAASLVGGALYPKLGTEALRDARMSEAGIAAAKEREKKRKELEHACNAPQPGLFKFFKRSGRHGGR